jgi:hypothetical protein
MAGSSKRSVTFAGSSWRTRFRDGKNERTSEDNFFSRLDTSNLGVSFTAICEEDIEKWMTQMGLLDPTDDDDDRSLGTWEYSTSDADDLNTLRSTPTVASQKGTATNGASSIRSNSPTWHPSSSSGLGSPSRTSSQIESKGMSSPTNGLPSFEELEKLMLELWQNLSSHFDGPVASSDKGEAVSKSEPNGSSVKTRSVTFADDTKTRRSAVPTFRVWKQLRLRKLKKYKGKKTIKSDGNTKEKRWKMVLFRRKSSKPNKNDNDLTKNLAVENVERNGDRELLPSNNGKCEAQSQEETSYFLSFVPEETLEMFQNILRSFSNDEEDVPNESKEELAREGGQGDEEKNIDIAEQVGEPSDFGRAKTETNVDSRLLLDPNAANMGPHGDRRDRLVEEGLENHVPLTYTPSRRHHDDELAQAEVPSDSCVANDNMSDQTGSHGLFFCKDAPIEEESAPEGDSSTRKGNFVRRLLPFAATTKMTADTIASNRSPTDLVEEKLHQQSLSLGVVRAQSTDINASKMPNEEKEEFTLNKDAIMSMEECGNNENIQPTFSRTNMKSCGARSTKPRISLTRMLTRGGRGNSIAISKDPKECNVRPVQIIMDSTPFSGPTHENEDVTPKCDPVLSKLLQAEIDLNQVIQDQQNDQDNALMEEIHPWRPEALSENKNELSSRGLDEHQFKDEGFETIARADKRSKPKKRKKKSQTATIPKQEPDSFPIKTIEFPSDFDVAADDRFGDEIEDPCIVYVKVRRLVFDEVEEHGEVEMPLSQYMDTKRSGNNDENSVNAVVHSLPGVLDISNLVIEATTDDGAIAQETKNWEKNSKDSAGKFSMRSFMSTGGTIPNNLEEPTPGSISGKETKKTPQHTTKRGLSYSWKSGLTKGLSFNRNRTKDTTTTQNALAARDDSDQEMTSQQSMDREQEIRNEDC